MQNNVLYNNFKAYIFCYILQNIIILININYYSYIDSVMMHDLV